MTILQKPNTVVFDPANRKHRDAVRAFMRRNAWGDSPIRFAYDPQFGSIADQVRSKLLDWYMAKEDKPKKVPKLRVCIDALRPADIRGIPARMLK